MAEAKKTTHYLKYLHFWLSEVKEAVEVIEAVEVTMAEGANKATEVVRFTQELEFNNLMARISLL